MRKSIVIRARRRKLRFPRRPPQAYNPGDSKSPGLCVGGGGDTPLLTQRRLDGVADTSFAQGGCATICPMPIRLLSDQLASQIAAGEVVERPVSVVKELVENALDAGATALTIEVESGGRKLIRVSDDGCGIPAAEVTTAFKRHATSKLAAIEDLNAIGTLGFRGEALAAIAAVSRVTLVTRSREEGQGTQTVLHGGEVVSQGAVGAPAGTVMSVADLFYNVPARLKFLKSISSEKRQIDEFVTRYALAYPQVRFSLSHNGRTTFQSSGNGNLRDTLVAIYGPDTARQLLEIDPATSAHAREETGEDALRIRVAGFAGPPSLHWSNRTHIVLFVNGRWIRDTQLTYAVIQAYHTLLPTGRYPHGGHFSHRASKPGRRQRASGEDGDPLSAGRLRLWHGAARRTGGAAGQRAGAQRRHL